MFFEMEQDEMIAAKSPARLGGQLTSTKGCAIILIRFSIAKAVIGTARF
jgi:hypothetical protein